MEVCMCRFVAAKPTLTLRIPNDQAGEFDAALRRSAEALAMEDEAAICYESPTSDCSCSLEAGTCMPLRMFTASRHNTEVAL
jgi:hypothetical protein